MVLIPTVKALWEWGVFHLFGLGSAWVGFDQIARDTRANRGYLRVALRLLVACGWLSQCATSDGSNRYALTVEGKTALQIGEPALYSDATRFYPQRNPARSFALRGMSPTRIFGSRFRVDYAEQARLPLVSLSPSGLSR